MNVFLDALSDAWGQMTGTLAVVAQAFGENWRTGLAALLDRPAALFYVVGVVAVLALTFSGVTVGSRVGYQRGRFLSANEKIFLRTLDVALGRNYRAFAQVRLAEIANERRDRDAFVDAVFAEFGVPLLRVKAQRTYSVAELRALFARAELSPPPQSHGVSL